MAVTALSASTGATAWSDAFTPPCAISAEVPAISGGTVYAGWSGGIVAISLDSGAIVWDNQAVGTGFDPLSVTRTEVIGSPRPDPGYSYPLIALSRTDGSVLWRSTSKLDETMGATFGGLTWALGYKPGTGNARVVAFNAGNGDQVFATAPFSDDVQSDPPVVQAGRVYVNTRTALECLALPA